VIETYLAHSGARVVRVPCPTGVLEPAVLAKHLGPQTAALLVQTPNFFGNLEIHVAELSDQIHKAGGLLIASAYPVSLGLLTPPGDYGADIAVAEGQSLGLPLAYGGPYLGLLRLPQRIDAQNAGPRGGPNRRQRGPARLRPHAPGPGTTHPPGKGDLQHLHEPGALRPGVDDLSVLGGKKAVFKSWRSSISKRPTTRRGPGQRGFRPGFRSPVLQRVRGALSRAARKDHRDGWPKNACWPGFPWGTTTPTGRTSCWCASPKSKPRRTSTSSANSWRRRPDERRHRVEPSVV
jgi:hypothetical protein